MAPYSKLSKEKLKNLKSDLEKQFEEIKKKGLNLDMSRGKPSIEQLNLSMGMLDVLNGDSELVCTEGVDCRNYGVLDGITEAKQLLAETDYNGEPFIWYTTKDYPYMYKIAVAASKQMEEAGFNVDVQVVDWATITQKRTDPSAYGIFSGATTFTADPGVMPHLDGSWPGWWENAEKDQMIIELNGEADPEKRQEIWDEFQEKWLYGDVPFIKIGDYFLLSTRSKDLKNFDEGPFTYFWNCYLEQ